MVGQGTLLRGPRRGIWLAENGNKSRLDVSVEHELVASDGVILDERAVLEGLPGRMAVLLDALGELLQLIVLAHAIEVERREALRLDQGMEEAEHLGDALTCIEGAARNVAGIERAGRDRDRVLDNVNLELTAFRALASSSNVRSELVRAELNGTEAPSEVGKERELVTATLHEQLSAEVML